MDADKRMGAGFLKVVDHFFDKVGKKEPLRALGTGVGVP